MAKTYWDEHEGYADQLCAAAEAQAQMATDDAAVYNAGKEAGREEALREVAKWLERKRTTGSPPPAGIEVCIFVFELDKLKSGRMPKE